jgi:hypothetical protein
VLLFFRRHHQTIPTDPISNIQQNSISSNRNLLLFIVIFIICYLPSCAFIIQGFILTRNICQIFETCDSVGYSGLVPMIYLNDALAYFPLIRCTIDPIVGIIVDRRLRNCGRELILIILSKLKLFR